MKSFRKSIQGGQTGERWEGEGYGKTHNLLNRMYCTSCFSLGFSNTKNSVHGFLPVVPFHMLFSSPRMPPDLLPWLILLFSILPAGSLPQTPFSSWANHFSLGFQNNLFSVQISVPLLHSCNCPSVATELWYPWNTRKTWETSSGKTGYLHTEEWNWNLFTHYQNNSKWIQDLM